MIFKLSVLYRCYFIFYILCKNNLSVSLNICLCHLSNNKSLETNDGRREMKAPFMALRILKMWMTHFDGSVVDKNYAGSCGNQNVFSAITVCILELSRQFVFLRMLIPLFTLVGSNQLDDITF
jgi:hypothetical protein